MRLLRRNILGTLAAIGTLFSAAAFSQDACDPDRLCFARGEVKLGSPDDVANFVATYRERLGLVGNETFRCTLSTWLTVVSHPYLADRAYVCEQPHVQGVPGKYLAMRIAFWNRDGGVHSVSCRCVREDARLPRPTVTRRQAEERGLRYFYARFPDIPQSDIRVVESLEPVIQWDLRKSQLGSYRPVRNVVIEFPLLHRQLLPGITRGRATVSVDALDGSVIRAVAAETYLFGPGIPVTEIDEQNARLAAMPFGWEQFELAQKFSAYGARGETERAQELEQALKSRARWEPEGFSRFIAHFSRPTSAEELIRFLDDYDLLMLEAYFRYLQDGQLRTSGVTAKASGGDSPSALIGDLSARARTSAINEMTRSAKDPQGSATPAEPAELHFTIVEFEMRHSDALRLYEKELGRRILALTPINGLGIDMGTDLF